MWFRVELHSERARRGGLLQALTRQLASHPHYMLVTERRITNFPCDNSEVGSRETANLLNQCSVAYAGTRHMCPVSPYSGFSVAAELGIAYLEHLIDYDPLPETRNARRWTSASLHAFVSFLFLDHPEVNTVVPPLPIDPETHGEMREVPVDDRYHVIRTGQGDAPEA